MANVCSDIEKELEAELANIGIVAASYDITDLRDDGRLSKLSEDSQDANPLSSLGGFDEFALCVQEANEVKDRAVMILDKAESILENHEGSCQAHDGGRVDDGGRSSDEDISSACIDTGEREVASADKCDPSSFAALFISNIG